MVSDTETKQELPLLQTKISIPQLPLVFVHRSRLIKRIDLGVRGPLTLLIAPAGFGKTNLLLEWAAHNLRSSKPLSIAWLSLDREDDNSSRFLHYLISAFTVLDPQLGQEAMDFFQSAATGSSEQGLTLLLNELSSFPNEIVLVLDDFHVIENSSIHRSTVFLLKHLPRNIHVVIASRREPALDLASLRTKGWVTEIGMDELRFDAEEISLFFFQIMGLQLPQNIVQILEQRTEGWITPLKLVAISMRNRPDPNTLLASFHGNVHYLMEFLSEEVLSRQPEDIRRFLLCTSILDVLCGPLCEAVVDPGVSPGYGAGMLDRLEHTHLLLTSLDLQREWFRYHPLFGDFLRHEQHALFPEQTPLLHKRAAAWFERYGNLDEAFKHALASGDSEFAGDLMERNIEPLIKAGGLQILTSWIGKLPEEEIHKRPLISLAYAWSSIAAFQLENARYWLDDLEQSLEKLPAGNSSGEFQESKRLGSIWNIQGGLAICRSTLALLSGDAQGAADFSEEAANHLKGDNPFMQSMISLERSLHFIFAGETSDAIEALQETTRLARRANNLLALVNSLCRLAQMQAIQGHLSQALATLQKARFAATGPDGNPLPLMGLVEIEFGKILRQRDLLNEAKEWLEHGLQVARSLWSLETFDGLISLARLLQSQGDYGGSQAAINEASQLAVNSASEWDVIIAAAVSVQLALLRDDLLTATKEWEKTDQLKKAQKGSLESYPYQVYELLQLTLARLSLGIGRENQDRDQFRRALEILDALLSAAEKLERLTPMIEILALQAISQAAMGKMDLAVPILMRALALGEPEDYRRIFLDEGKPMGELLLHCWQAQLRSHALLPSLGYIESLLETVAPGEGPSTFSRALPPGGIVAKTDYGLPISLSSRELQVLSLIAQGKSNQEISAELYLALNTVKRHAYNIYAKLEVKKRTQAVSKARQLGLIP